MTSRRRPLVWAVLGLLALAVSACGGSSASATHAPTITDASGFDQPDGALTARRAPAFTLDDQFGTPTSLADYRGKAVLLTFLYVHCPDICPLITASLRTTLDRLGAEARRVQVIAVSVDPVGDTGAAVRRYLRVRGLLHRFQYLVGTRAQLAHVWAEYHIAAVPDNTLKRTIGHTGIVLGIDARGIERTLYLTRPPNPTWMAHDVPLLARAA